ncbi:MAG: hypothetical protein WKF78_07340 [Candidatus Limnocylindrales bacterium]
MSTDHPIDLARSLRPQTFAKVAPDRIVDPIVEPVWGGIRLIAAAHPAGAALFDQGEELTDQPHLAQALATAVAETKTHGVILDGYLTKQVATELDPVNLVDPDPLPSTGKLVAQSMFLGLRRDRAAELAQRVEREREERTFAPDEAVNLVVVDLLWLDGEWLLDVPSRSASACSTRSCRSATSSAPARTSDRHSTGGSGPGARRGSPASRSRRRIRAIDPASPPPTGRPPRCPAADRSPRGPRGTVARCPSLP